MAYSGILCCLQKILMAVSSTVLCGDLRVVLHELISNIDNEFCSHQMASLLCRLKRSENSTSLPSRENQYSTMSRVLARGQDRLAHVFLSSADARFALVQSNNESTTEQKILNDSGELTTSLRKPESGVILCGCCQDRVHQQQS